MSDREPQTFTLLGLHRLAAQKGDGLVPELHALLMARACAPPPDPNVVAFPARSARLPVFEDEGQRPTARNDNVLAFPHAGGRHTGRETA